MFDINQDSHKAFRGIASERTKGVVIWIGAGLSKPAGLPLWSELRSELCEVGCRKANQFRLASEQEHLRKKCEVAQTLPLWNAFGVLRKALGTATYNETIKRCLAPADTTPVPEVYKKLWQLRPSGILNLNLDRLATRSHRDLNPLRGINECVGRQIAGNFGLLKASLPFILYLHGTVNDATSWVMTDAELKGLMATPGYKEFITACFASRAVLFVGMSADDIAAGGHLAALTARGIDAGGHFWVTSRADAATNSWAEKAGIQTIHYRSSSDNHDELIEFFDDILTYLPPEQFAPPVALPTVAMSTIATLPTPEQLVQTADSDEIRKLLNAEATRILMEPTQEAYAEFEKFSKQYDQAIWRAWYITTEAPDNKLIGFTLSKEIARGAFGKVYLAKRDGSNEDLAIKVLHHDIRRDPQLLQSFRRGVRSMEILSTSNIEGMIPYREASEIPAFAVMDFVEGPNLSQAVKSDDIRTWGQVLSISTELAKIIDSAHRLPERVLHRDLRPANIMLKNFHRGATEIEVLVLDFDLSWHRGASELSIMAPQAVSGFLAPEQVQRDPKVSTRHAAIDSFGLGMTLYFLRSGREPMFGQNMRATWLEELERDIACVDCNKWKSLPRRFARLIYLSTRDRQSERWDMSQILSELERMKEAEATPESVRSAELYAEELAHNTDIGANYKWDADMNQAIQEFPGTTFIVRGLEATGEVEAELVWERGGPNVKKYIRNAAEKAAAELKKANWKPQITEVKDARAQVSAKIHISNLQTSLRDAADALSAAFRAFKIH